MKYYVLTVFYLICLLDCIYSQNSRDILGGKIFCAENSASKYDSIKFFKNDFKLVFKNKKIEEGEWNLRKKPNESKGYLVFNPNLKNTDEIIFTIIKNDLSEIINVIIDNNSFILCTNNSSEYKDTIATNIEKVAELNLTEKIIKDEIAENKITNRLNQVPEFNKKLNEIESEISNTDLAINDNIIPDKKDINKLDSNAESKNNVVKTLNQVPEFNKQLNEIESKNSNADLAINDNIIANKKDVSKSDSNAESENNAVPEILYYDVIQIAAFLDFMNAEKYFAKANVLGYNVKINFREEFYKIYIIPEKTENINLILQVVKGKINNQAFITNIYK
jgi:hypothetical protein